MAQTLVQAYARSAWRVRTVWNQAVSGVVPGDFSLVRTDGGPCAITVARVITFDDYSLELALSERMIAGVAYQLVWSGSHFGIGFLPPAGQSRALDQLDTGDPDAEINGVDLAWISHDPGPDGDCQRRSGLDCVRYDLPNRAVLKPTELVQNQTAGLGFEVNVNGALSDAEILRQGSQLENEFRRDDRVADAEVDVTESDSGSTVTFGGQVQTRAGQSTPVRST